jgi:hypothetical protein
MIHWRVKSNSWAKCTSLFQLASCFVRQICKCQGTSSILQINIWAEVAGDIHVILSEYSTTPGGPSRIIVISLTCLHKPPFHPLAYIRSCFSGFISYLLVKPSTKIEWKKIAYDHVSIISLKAHETDLAATSSESRNDITELYTKVPWHTKGNDM